MEKVPPSFARASEIMPAEHMQRGAVRTIAKELTYHEEQARRPGTNYQHVKIYDIDPLLTVQNEGYKFIMRLPRVNHDALEAKYNRHYDKTVRYFQFIDTLARSNGITRLKHTTDDFYVFDTAEDAEKLKLKLIEQQEKAELEFEVIEGNQPPRIPDRTDTNL